ncbi:hypothetical protein H6F47_18445 [Sphaerospermopsis sp. FACHB-1094]|nr:hypothetical protein [Sphaerospermopsis sp. FACHB-1094]MBD2134359.1 hypothetical protein [Sphaerospermopsis sp. FACHB-1094]
MLDTQLGTGNHQNYNGKLQKLLSRQFILTGIWLPQTVKFTIQLLP